MDNQLQEPDLNAVRSLLLAAFEPEDLRRFCLDRPILRPIVDRFGAKHGLDDMVDEVIDYCRVNLLWFELLDEVQNKNPRQFARFAPQIDLAKVSGHEAPSGQDHLKTVAEPAPKASKMPMASGRPTKPDAASSSPMQDGPRHVVGTLAEGSSPTVSLEPVAPQPRPQRRILRAISADWTRDRIIAVLGMLIAMGTCIAAALVVPEVREWLGLQTQVTAVPSSTVPIIVLGYGTELISQTTAQTATAELTRAATATASVTQLPADKPTQTRMPTRLPTATRTPTGTPIAIVTPQMPSTVLPTPAPTKPRPTSRPTDSLSGLIIFTCDNEICSINADGSNIQFLTSTGASNESPVTSPNGRLIAFTSNQDSGWGVYVMGIDGSAVRRAAGHFAIRPSWSPDGQTIAFEGDQGEGDGIYIMNVDGTNIHKLVANKAGSGRGGRCSWSPDGMYIAFVSYGQNDDIQILELGTLNQRNLTDHPAWDRYPAWSPDGNRIAFVSSRDGNWEVYVVRVDGTGLSRLTTNPSEDIMPTWSKDGKHIAFVSNRTGNYKIWTMNADGSDQRKLTGDSADDYYPYWFR